MNIEALEIGSVITNIHSGTQATINRLPNAKVKSFGLANPDSDTKVFIHVKNLVANWKI